MVRIAAVDADGDVPALLVENRAHQPLLLVQGEIFAGMKQNWVTDTTVLVAPKSTVEIPVSCVDAGRWHEESADRSSTRLPMGPF